MSTTPEEQPAADRAEDDEPTPTEGPAAAEETQPTEGPAAEETHPATQPIQAVDAGKTTEETAPEAGREKPRKGSFLREIPILVLIALVIAILVKTFLVQAFYIPSGSMEPTLQVGDRVLVNKLAYHLGDIHRGDVIVFQNPDPAQVPKRNWFSAAVHWLGQGLGFQQPEDEDLIKRVIGLPGDTVTARDGQVYVNGEKISEPYLAPDTTTSMSRSWTVPSGDLFVLGDNRANSADSRFFGFVPKGKVIGRAFVIIWPPSDMGGLGG
jgi:signal peptidase I